jgi:Uma2 family endonuclease
MVMKDDVALMTATEFEEYANQNPNRLLELLEGKIIEKMPTEEHGACAGNIYALLRTFLKENRIGRATIEARHRSTNDPNTVLLPDVSFRVTQEQRVQEGSINGSPDLAVEVKSPTDSLKEIRAKVRYYLANGTRLVWVVLPQQKMIEVYSLEEEAVLTLTDMLTGGTILPNFSTPVSEIFADTVGE